jgi:hypothetical protein
MKEYVVQMDNINFGVSESFTLEYTPKFITIDDKNIFRIFISISMDIKLYSKIRIKILEHINYKFEKKENTKFMVIIPDDNLKYKFWGIIMNKAINNFTIELTNDLEIILDNNLKYDKQFKIEKIDYKKEITRKIIL